MFEGKSYKIFKFSFAHCLYALSFLQVLKAAICLSITCHRSLPTPIWLQLSCHLGTLSRQRCSLISRRVSRNVSVSFPSIIRSRHRWPLSQWTAFRWARSVWRCNWRSPRMHPNRTRTKKSGSASMRTERKIRKRECGRVIEKLKWRRIQLQEPT